MAVGTLFTLFVVPVFYTLFAADHKVVALEGVTAEMPVPALQPIEGVAHA